MHFNMLPNSSLARYLGVFFCSFHPKKMDLHSILSKTEKRINLWESNFLSKAGRLRLIQSNLESQPSYTCASTLLNSDLAKSIDSIHKKFFWRQNSIPLIPWDKIFAQISGRVLGYAKPFRWTKLLLPTDQNNIWVKLMKAKYLHTQSFFNCSPKPQDSPIWRKILQQQHVLRKGIRWKIGDGHQILFWLHNWCSHDSLIKMLHINMIKSIFICALALSSFLTELGIFTNYLPIYPAISSDYLRDPAPNEPYSWRARLGSLLHRRVYCQISQLASP